MSGRASRHHPSAYGAPEAVLAEHAGEVHDVKRLGARCGRTLGDESAHTRARKRLRTRLEGVDSARLRYWALVVRIDSRWCAATGHGGFWAAASRCVNEEARAIIARRSAGHAPFEIIARTRTGASDG